MRASIADEPLQTRYADVWFYASPRQHGDQSSRLLLYEGHQSCRVLAVEGGLGRSISGMQIAPFTGVVPPEPE